MRKAIAKVLVVVLVGLFGLLSQPPFSADDDDQGDDNFQEATSSLIEMDKDDEDSLVESTKRY